MFGRPPRPPYRALPPRRDVRRAGARTPRPASRDPRAPSWAGARGPPPSRGSSRSAGGCAATRPWQIARTLARSRAAPRSAVAGPVAIAEPAHCLDRGSVGRLRELATQVADVDLHLVGWPAERLL